MAQSSLIKADASKSKKPSRYGDSFQVVRRAVITLAITLGVGGGLIAASTLTADQWQINLVAANAKRDELRKRVTEAEVEKREIADFQTKFETLQARGLIGDEKRLEWVESIRRIHEKRRLFALTYDFAAQRPFLVDPTVTVGDIELRGTKMTMRLDLLHEQDLLRFFGDLRKDALQVVHSCKITRMPANPLVPLAPRLYSDCVLYWVTMKDKTEVSSSGP